MAFSSCLCPRRHAECAAYLLSLGADALAVDDAQRRNALHHAAAGAHVGALRALLSDAGRLRTEARPRIRPRWPGVTAVTAR